MDKLDEGELESFGWWKLWRSSLLSSSLCSFGSYRKDFIFLIKPEFNSSWSYWPSRSGEMGGSGIHLYPIATKIKYYFLMPWGIGGWNQESLEISVSSMGMQDLCPRATRDDKEGPSEAHGLPNFLSRDDVKVEIRFCFFLSVLLR